MKLNGAAILIECLIEQGVGTVFGFPGGAVLPGAGLLKFGYMLC